MTQYACDKANTLPKIKKLCNDLHTLTRMGYSTRNKQRKFREKSNAKKF